MKFLLVPALFIISSLTAFVHCQTDPNRTFIINDVVQVDLQIATNTLKHSTSFYKQINRPLPYAPYGPSVVLRRSNTFNMTIVLKRPYNSEQDKARLEFCFGPSPQLDRGTLLYVPLSTNTTLNNDNKLYASILEVKDNRLLVLVNLPQDMPIGVWRLRISTKILKSETLSTYKVPRALYIIFNPFSRKDDAYMARQDAQLEYVMNEFGKIYIGSVGRPVGRKWIYGQFNEAVLPVMMALLDSTRMSMRDRADIVKVSRQVSALMNSHDDNGLLVGDWSGNYKDGLAPWAWSGSAPVFERYLKTGYQPVKFGQCWVYGGVSTTALRSLGIPARTVTNFVSAHDTDMSLTVDNFYSERGEELKGINGDSIWNFHVWSDAWMTRRDLPPGYGGWQAIDSTPQETSMGRYQMGPASLLAIKQGKVGFAYDVAFVFSEINADVVDWQLDPSTSTWRQIFTKPNHVSQKVYTKMIGVYDNRGAGILDAENIIHQYKYPERSLAERAAYKEALRFGGLSKIYRMNR